MYKSAQNQDVQNLKEIKYRQIYPSLLSNEQKLAALAAGRNVNLVGSVTSEQQKR
jgi:hypothetical protein